MSLAGPSPFFLLPNRKKSNEDTDDDTDDYDPPIYLSNDKYRVASRRMFADAESVLVALTRGYFFFSRSSSINNILYNLMLFRRGSSKTS